MLASFNVLDYLTFWITVGGAIYAMLEWRRNSNAAEVKELQEALRLANEINNEYQLRQNDEFGDALAIKWWCQDTGVILPTDETLKAYKRAVTDDLASRQAEYRKNADS